MQPVIGMCIGVAEFQFVVGKIVVQTHRLCRVGKSQVRPVSFVPQIVVAHIAEYTGVAGHVAPQEWIGNFKVTAS